MRSLFPFLLLNSKRAFTLIRVRLTSLNTNTSCYPYLNPVSLPWTSLLVGPVFGATAFSQPLLGEDREHQTESGRPNRWGLSDAFINWPSLKWSEHRQQLFLTYSVVLLLRSSRLLFSTHFLHLHKTESIVTLLLPEAVLVCCMNTWVQSRDWIEVRPTKLCQTAFPFLPKSVWFFLDTSRPIAKDSKSKRQVVFLMYTSVMYIYYQTHYQTPSIIR